MPSTAAAGATAADRLSATSFPSGFLWGAATSAYQVEGAVDEEGRGLSIWDTFSHAPGRTAGGETGDVACDHYHRHAEDVALMASLGLGAYRFSVAWPRIQPEGRGPPNQAGLDFYRCLVAELRERDVVPVATLYHWDLPQWLQDAGGWPERDTAARFADYASIVAGALGDQVGLWITLNEPWVAAWLGYGVGIHAPGHRDLREAVAAGHHLLVGHGLAVDAIRTGGGRDVGITLDFLPFVPASDSDEDRAAACRADLHRNRWFLDPVMGLGYPGELLEHYRGSVDLSFIRDGDLDAIARPVDFVGANYYRRDLASARRPQGVQSDELPGRIGACT